MSKITHLLWALLCPDKNMVKDIEHFVFDFIWRGKTPRFRKEKKEAEIKEGGMKLHNLTLFSKCLKISWLRRLVTSRGNWTRIPQDIGIDKCLSLGCGYAKELVKRVTNPFWKCILQLVIQIQSMIKC